MIYTRERLIITNVETYWCSCHNCTGSGLIYYELMSCILFVHSDFSLIFSTLKSDTTFRLIILDNLVNPFSDLGDSGVDSRVE